MEIRLKFGMFEHDLFAKIKSELEKNRIPHKIGELPEFTMPDIVIDHYYLDELTIKVHVPVAPPIEQVTVRLV